MADDALLTLVAKVGATLKVRGWMLALAESCTGGGVAEAITAVPGSSGWFERGFVTYSNAAKVEMLGVSSQTLEAHGAVSEATALEMARGAIAHSHAQVAVAISGIAGPDGGTADKPVGMVWFGYATPDGVTSEKVVFSGNRAEVRRQAIVHALKSLLFLV